MIKKFFHAGVTLIFLLAPASVQPAFAGKRISVKDESNSPVILKTEDPVPANDLLVKTIQLTGTATYHDLVEKAKEVALKYGANIIHVEAHKTNYKGYELKACLYKVDDAKAYEREFSWSKSRKLVWNDFRGNIPADADRSTAAATLCGIGFETNTITEKNKDLKVHVYNTFYAGGSWAKTEEMTAEVLQHEQGHFDLCEVYTRKLRERLSHVNVTVQNLKPVLSRIYEEVQVEYRAAQNNYEEETEHGVNLDGQKKWMEFLDKELNATEKPVVS